MVGLVNDVIIKSRIDLYADLQPKKNNTSRTCTTNVRWRGIDLFITHYYYIESVP